jgi:hypothetical protein
MLINWGGEATGAMWKSQIAGLAIPVSLGLIYLQRLNRFAVLFLMFWSQ